MAKREMIAIKVYNDGKYTIEDSDPDYATQILGFADDKGSGLLYICRKDKKDFHLKKAVREVKKICDAKVSEALKIKANMDKLAEELGIN